MPYDEEIEEEYLEDEDEAEDEDDISVEECD
jgi:hypothetical protein